MKFNWYLTSQIIIVVVMIISIAVLMPGPKQVAKNQQEVLAQQEAKNVVVGKILTNEEVIAENKKCHDAGMKAQVRLWSDHSGVADVICYPQEQSGI